MRRTTPALLLLSVLLTAAPSAAIAQFTLPKKSLIALNPFGIPWDIFQIEAERAITEGGSIGLLGSYTDIDNERNATMDLKFRYYPGENVLNRLSTGLTLGYTNFSRLVWVPDGSFGGFGRESRETLAAPTVGVILDYNWIHGPSGRFLIGVGVGAKRILSPADERARLHLDRAYMTGRFVIGLTF